MKQARTVLLLYSLVLLLVSGCADSPVQSSEAPESPSPTIAATEKPSESPVSVSPVAEEFSVNVDYATAALLDKYDSFNEFIEFEEEGYQKIIFTVNIAVKNFSFIELGYTEGEDGLGIVESAVLYALDELSPGKPFVVTWMEWGSIPHRGISFTDEAGEARSFYVSMSGKDGSLLLVEF